jgi:hypothetical protein
MNELTIDGKTYISSKRAAEITGYARDYVGQLAREGHVVARLVGRSWYVLESSIREHRFGKEGEEAAAAAQKPGRPDAMRTWDAPKYASEAPQELEMPAKDADTGRTDATTLAAMHSAWQEWFSMKGDISAEAAEEIAAEEEVVIEEPAEKMVEEEPGLDAAKSVQDDAAPSNAVSIPIERIRPAPRPIEAMGYQRPISTAHTTPAATPEPPARSTEMLAERPSRRARKGRGRSGAALRALFIAVAVLAAVIGVVGSGIADPLLAKYHVQNYAEILNGGTEYAR